MAEKFRRRGFRSRNLAFSGCKRSKDCPNRKFDIQAELSIPGNGRQQDLSIASVLDLSWTITSIGNEHLVLYSFRVVSVDEAPKSRTSHQ